MIYQIVYFIWPIRIILLFAPSNLVNIDLVNRDLIKIDESRLTHRCVTNSQSVSSEKK